MFLLMLNYVAPIEKVDEVLEEHGKFLDKYYSKKKFILSGRRKPRTGGLIICNAENIKEVHEIIKEDPFTRNGAAEYEIIEFSPTKYAEGLEAFINL